MDPFASWPEWMVYSCLQFLSLDNQWYARHWWHKFPPGDVATVAVKNGWLDLLQWASAQGYPIRPAPSADVPPLVDLAARQGSIEVLQWLRESQAARWTGQTCGEAARAGHLETVRWLRAHNCGYTSAHPLARAAEHSSRMFFDVLALEDWGELSSWARKDLMTAAVESGDFDFFKQVVAMQPQTIFDSSLLISCAEAAAKAQNMQILQWLDEVFASGSRGQALHLRQAVMLGEESFAVPVLEWLFTWPPCEEWMRSAGLVIFVLPDIAKRGDSEALFFLLKRRLITGTEPFVHKSLVRFGRLDMWKRLGVMPPDADVPELLVLAAAAGQIEMFKWLSKFKPLSPGVAGLCIIDAILGRQFEFVQWALDQEWPGVSSQDYSRDYFRDCLEKGSNVSVVSRMWPVLRSKTCQKTYKVAMELAAKNKLWAVLRWLYDQGCFPWSRTVLVHTVAAGNLEMTQWVRSKGCPWSAKVCAVAARHGHLHILRWLRDNGCPWNHGTTASAVAGGFLNVLQWALAHKCRIDSATALENAVFYGHLDIYCWLMQQNHRPRSEQALVAVSQQLPHWEKEGFLHRTRELAHCPLRKFFLSSRQSAS